MFCILGAFVFIDISSPIGRFSETRNQNGIIVMSTSIPLILLGIDKKHNFHVIKQQLGSASVLCLGRVKLYSILTDFACIDPVLAFFC